MAASDQNRLPHQPATWYIVGAGAMGCLWAARLLTKGDQCIFLVKPDRLKEYSPVPKLIYNSPEHQCSEHIVEIQAVNSPLHAIENLILATKAGGVEPAIHELTPFIKPRTRIVMLQNGMGTQQHVVEQFPDNPAWAASVTDGAWLKATLNVQHAGYGITAIGPMTSAATKSGQTLYDDLQAPNLTLSVTDNIEQKLWLKLAINSCINGLTVLYHCRNGELLDGAEREQHLELLCAETSQLLEATGQHPTQPLLSTVKQIAKATGANYSSSYQDVENGRQTELAWINNVLIKEANKQQLQVPAHVALMKALEAYI